MESHNRAKYHALELKKATECNDCGTLFATQSEKLAHVKAAHHRNTMLIKILFTEIYMNVITTKYKVMTSIIYDDIFRFY